MVTKYSDKPEYYREWQRNRRATPEGKKFIRRMNLRATHKMTVEEYDNLLQVQNNVCAVCKLPETSFHQSGTANSLCVDHDRTCCPGDKSCGKCTRGLLCNRCNRALGLLHDDTSILEALIQYVNKYSKVESKQNEPLVFSLS